MEQINSIALYLRISKEDLGRDAISRYESNSIENQRQLLYDYIKKNLSTNKSRIEEYCDDGYSGTNFNRPAMIRLLEDMRNNKITCIVVKDFSRFGRNYLEVGNYLERILPIYHIRFISVNDGYDSLKMEQSTWLSYAFKNIMNDYYSRDISKKVKASLAIRKKHGQFMGVMAPYGYRKSESCKGTLMIDEEASQIVRVIFEWRINGKSLSFIAKELNRKGIVTPLEHIKKYSLVDGEDTVSTSKQGDIKYWKASTISRILNNPIYTGTVSNGKFKAYEVGSKRKRKLKKENWITVSNMHEAIIDDVTFQKVQSLRIK